MPNLHQTLVAHPFSVGMKNVAALNLILSSINYGHLAGLTTTDPKRLKEAAETVRFEYKNVIAYMENRWRKKYNELAEALTGNDESTALTHEGLVHRASNCFYGRTRMDSEDGRLKVGDSAFEGWFAEEYMPDPSNTVKQDAREAYEAGMNDPITLIPSPTMKRVQEWMNAIDAAVMSTKEETDELAFLRDTIGQEIYETLFGKRAPGNNADYLINVDGSSGHLGAMMKATEYVTKPVDITNSPTTKEVEEFVDKSVNIPGLRITTACHYIIVLAHHRDTLRERLDNLIAGGMAEKPVPTSATLSSVIDDFRRREDLGKAKYATTVDRTDIDAKGWLRHLSEELMDAVLYARRLADDKETK